MPLHAAHMQHACIKPFVSKCVHVSMCTKSRQCQIYYVVFIRVYALLHIWVSMYNFHVYLYIYMYVNLDMCVCACVHAHAGGRAGGRACVRACVRVCVCVHSYVCSWHQVKSTAMSGALVSPGAGNVACQRQAYLVTMP